MWRSWDETQAMLSPKPTVSVTLVWSNVPLRPCLNSSWSFQMEEFSPNQSLSKCSAGPKQYQGTYQKYKCSGSTPDLQNQELEGWSPWMWFNKPSPWWGCMRRKFENHCSGDTDSYVINNQQWWQQMTKAAETYQLIQIPAWCGPSRWGQRKSRGLL